MFVVADGELTAELVSVVQEGDVAVATVRVTVAGRASDLAVPFPADRLAAGERAAAGAHLHRLAAAIASASEHFDEGVSG